MIALATVIGVLLFALGITGPNDAAVLAGCILLGATMVSVQIGRLTASLEKPRKQDRI